MKIGILREGKVPPDSRVAFSPAQCVYLREERQLDVVVQPSPHRCFPDSDYQTAGIPLQEDLSDCSVLIGIKEVPKADLLPEKTYFFFSHTIKEQPYNKTLLQTVLQKKITLVDYEVLKGENGKRVIAFGKFAGMVGAHNGLYTYAQRTGTFELPRINTLYDYEAAKEVYRNTTFPAMKVVLTGTGRVGQGAALVLRDMGFEEITPEAFLETKTDQPVFTILKARHYVTPTEGSWTDVRDFYRHPKAYKSTFAPYTKVADLFINGIYWDNDAPAFFTMTDLQNEDWNIKVIADVTCDIAPVASIPTTLKASTIADPIFGIDRLTGKEVLPYQPGVLDMMTIDNLPSELPRDASQAFGEMFIEHVLDPFLTGNSAMLEQASVTINGALGPHFQYLKNYAEVD